MHSCRLFSSPVAVLPPRFWRAVAVEPSVEKSLQAIVFSARLMLACIRVLVDWEGVVMEFSDKIGAVIGEDKLTMADCAFTTTTAVDKLVSRITLMDAVKHYFDLHFYCGCGIPWIRLRGTVDDWKVRLPKEFSCQGIGCMYECAERCCV